MDGVSMVSVGTLNVEGYQLYGDADNDSKPINLSSSGCLENSFQVLLYQITIPIVFAVIVLVGILGNALFIYVIISKKKLQTPTNLLLLNLAIADVSFLLVCGTFTVVHYALLTWPLGDALCRIIQYLLYTTAYVTVYTLIAVSAVRYVTVVYGPKAAFIRRKRNIVVLIVAIWVVFMMAKVPILVVHGVSFDDKTSRTECIISGKTDGQRLFATFFVFAYALPLAVICTLYLLMVCHLRRNAKRSPISRVVNSAEERSRHVTKIVILVVTVFAVCWLPLQLHLLVAYYYGVPDTNFYKICLLVWHCLTYSNSLLNPIIYNFFSRDFRESFQEVIFCRPKEVESTSV